MSTTVFHTPGLNHHSTPCPRSATPEDIDKAFRRPSFNGTGWPKDSPIAKTYDVSNSTTQMILLNNKLKAPRLRGYKSSSGSISHPDPNRHLADRIYVNRDAHQKCLNSESPVFTPEPPIDLGWVNATERRPHMSGSGSSVNTTRHISCKPLDDNVLLWKRHRARTRVCRSAELVRDTGFMNEIEKIREKNYLLSIARVYSVYNLKKIKQKQYAQIFRREQSKGVYRQEQCDRYEQYLFSYRRTQSGPGEYRRVQSACAGRGQESRYTKSKHSKSSESLTTLSVTKKNVENGSEKSRPQSRKSVSSKTKKRRQESDEKASKTSKTGKTSGKARSKTATDKNKNSSEAQVDPAVKITYGYGEVKSESEEEKTNGTTEDSEQDGLPAALPPQHYTSPREGHGRPMSRLGRGSIVSKEENEDENYNSDFSDDSESSRGSEKHEKKSMDVEVKPREKPKGETSSLQHFDDRGGEDQKKRTEENDEKTQSKKSDDQKKDESYSDDQKKDKSYSDNQKKDESYSDDQKKDESYSDDQKKDESYSDDQKKDESYSYDQKKDGSYSDHQKKDESYSDHQKKDESYSDDQKKDGSYSDDQKKDGSYSDDQKKDKSSSDDSTDDDDDDDYKTKGKHSESSKSSMSELSSTQQSSTNQEKSNVTDTSEHTTTIASANQEKADISKNTTGPDDQTSKKSPSDELEEDSSVKSSTISKVTEQSTPKADREENRKISREDSVELTNGKARDVNQIEY